MESRGEGNSVLRLGMDVLEPRIESAKMGERQGALKKKRIMNYQRHGKSMLTPFLAWAIVCEFDVISYNADHTNWETRGAQYPATSCPCSFRSGRNSVLPRGCSGRESVLPVLLAIRVQYCCPGVIWFMSAAPLQADATGKREFSPNRVLSGIRASRFKRESLGVACVPKFSGRASACVSDFIRGSSGGARASKSTLARLSCFSATATGDWGGEAVMGAGGREDQAH